MMGKRENILAATHNDEGFVVFDHVQKSYDGEILVVKDLNLSIGKGEFLTLLGPSGSGKTTCLMMLAGFETATNGDIRLDGKPSQSAKRKCNMPLIWCRWVTSPVDALRSSLVVNNNVSHWRVPWCLTRNWF